VVLDSPLKMLELKTVRKEESLTRLMVRKKMKKTFGWRMSICRPMYPSQIPSQRRNLWRYPLIVCERITIIIWI